MCDWCRGWFRRAGISVRLATGLQRGEQHGVWIVPLQKVVRVEVIHEAKQIAIHDIRVSVDDLAHGSSGQTCRLVGWTVGWNAGWPNRTRRWFRRGAVGWFGSGGVRLLGRGFVRGAPRRIGGRLRSRGVRCRACGTGRRVGRVRERDVIVAIPSHATGVFGREQEIRGFVGEPGAVLGPKDAGGLGGSGVGIPERGGRGGFQGGGAAGRQRGYNVPLLVTGVHRFEEVAVRLLQHVERIAHAIGADKLLGNEVDLGIVELLEGGAAGPLHAARIRAVEQVRIRNEAYHEEVWEAFSVQTLHSPARDVVNVGIPLPSKRSVVVRGTRLGVLVAALGFAAEQESGPQRGRGAVLRGPLVVVRAGHRAAGAQVGVPVLCVAAVGGARVGILVAAVVDVLEQVDVPTLAILLVELDELAPRGLLDLVLVAVRAAEGGVLRVVLTGPDAVVGGTRVVLEREGGGTRGGRGRGRGGGGGGRLCMGVYRGE